MQDFCFRASDEASIILALESIGLTAPDMDGKQRPAGVYCYDGEIIDQQGQYRINPDGTTTTSREPTYHPGVYAKYRATDEQVTTIHSATLPPDVEIVAPPAGLPLFGGEWLGGPDIDGVKASRISEATSACDSVLAPLGREYGAYEMATWDQQYSEAVTYTADPMADVPLLASMCVARGVSIANLAARVIANRAAWVALTGNVIGQRQRIVDQISACETVEEVMAVEISISLPG